MKYHAPLPNPMALPNPNKPKTVPIMIWEAKFALPRRERMELRKIFHRKRPIAAY
jgi:hypothetical protein